MSQISQVIQTKPIRISNLWLPILFVMATGGLLFVIIMALVAYQVMYIDRIYPGVQVAGIEAGGMSQLDLVAAVSARTPEYLSRSVTIQAGDESWTFTGQELGMRLDAVATANAAYAIGRKGNLLVDMLTQLQLLRTPRSVEPVILYDSGPSNQVLVRLAEQLYMPPQDARLTIYPDARVEVTEARRGRQMMVEATQPLVEAALFDDNSQPVQAIVQEIAPGITNLEPARSQAQALLSAPMVFNLTSDAGKEEWRLEPQTLVGMMRVVDRVNAAGETEFSVQLDRDKFIAFFQELAGAIHQDPVDARVAFDPATTTLQVVEESREGRELDVEAAYRQVEATLQQPSHFFELPIQTTAPALSSSNIDGSLGIKDLVSEATTYFKGSSESRIRNIALAASRFNNVVVAPGQVFSFNEFLGPVTKEAGYDESLVIQGNRTSVGLGGGVCQVSTTAFRAAFFGGYEIVERWAHGYRVSWYETNSVPGLDATVYTPNVDFKFRNDTNYFLLIQTETNAEAGTVTFRFYSTKTGREVTVSEPEKSNLVKHGPDLYEDDPSLPKGKVKQVDWAVDGLDVKVTRTVKEGEKVIHEDVIFSHYSPWQAVFKVGTAG